MKVENIKFRAKRTDDGAWVYGDLTHVQRICTKEQTEKSGRRTEPAVRIANYDVDEETIGQFTGLYDNSGKAVYEGDLLSGEDNNVIVVVWFDAGFCDCNSNAIVSLRELGVEDRKVIGNIYDNKELLTQEYERID
ncbi:YopX family protein [Prevotella sp. P2-180]|uniref:YopX family protein n=1 Tax=Prevotella sp. P2-180 TaxID=2024224 RepID=UPI000B979163|nr:YopX family protein [Prevotella sp. P2-180]OYP67019.1 hypothetical protein CIK98_06370 [Prevotella sp. P2-180]